MAARLDAVIRHLRGGDAAAAPRPAAAEERVYHYGGGNSDAHYDFGSAEQNRRCAAQGAAMLEEAAAAGRLDLSQHEWGFSEEYTEPPARLINGPAPLADQKVSSYWFQISGGKVTWGAGDKIPASCLALPGFHITAQWGMIANASGYIYDGKGQQQRARNEAQLNKDMKAAGKGKPPQSFLDIVKTKPQIAPWPRDVGKALGDRPGREGLHNGGARTMRPSPELADLPMSKVGVPVWTRMSDAQKQKFCALLHR